MQKKTFRLSLGGVCTGAANGLFGGGGGMIVVPVLERAGNLGALSAHATAIAVILPASLVSAIIYLVCGLVPFQIYLPVALGALFGGILGARLLPNISAHSVTMVFALLMLVAGIRMVI